MSIMFGFLIFIAIISTIVLFGLAMIGHWKDDGKSNSLWKPVIILMIVTAILMINRALITEGSTLNDVYLGLWMLLSIAMFISIASSRFYKMKYKERGKFKKISWTAFGIGFVLFLLFAVTLPETTVEEGAGAAESEVVETSKTVAEDNEDELAAEQEEQAEVKKREQEAKEKADEEKEREERLAEEKAEQDKKEQEIKEKEEQEKLTAEKKAKEEKEKLAAEKKSKDEEEQLSIEGLQAVTLYRVVDGDTVHVLDSDNTTLKLRLLLIDTPETVHPNKPVELFGPEASARMIELVSNADQLHIEYDTGDQTDHYGRHLVYLYADGVNVHEVMLEEGLARVGYIYEQQRYLTEFREKEQHAKDNQLGIWSIPGYVNEGGEGFNSEEKETVEEPASNPNVNQGSAADSGESYNFANCTELKTVFPDGVASNHSAYQSKMDRDKDNWACE